MAISILVGPKLIAFLRAREYGQHIREDGPAGHLVKQGTPTMGGVLFVLSAAIPFLILSRYTAEGLTVFFITLACGAIGFIDARSASPGGGSSSSWRRSPSAPAGS